MPCGEDVRYTYIKILKKTEKLWLGFHLAFSLLVRCDRDFHFPIMSFILFILGSHLRCSANNSSSVVTLYVKF